MPDLNLHDPSSACNGGIHPVLSGAAQESGVHSGRAVFSSEAANPVDKVTVRRKPDFSEKDEQHFSVSHFGGERERVETLSIGGDGWGTGALRRHLPAPFPL